MVSKCTAESCSALCSPPVFFGLVARTCFWGKVGKEMARSRLWVCASSRGYSVSADGWWTPAA